MVLPVKNATTALISTSEMLTLSDVPTTLVSFGDLVVVSLLVVLLTVRGSLALKKNRSRLAFFYWRLVFHRCLG